MVCGPMVVYMNVYDTDGATDCHTAMVEGAEKMFGMELFSANAIFKHMHTGLLLVLYEEKKERERSLNCAIDFSCSTIFLQSLPYLRQGIHFIASEDGHNMHRKSLLLVPSKFSISAFTSTIHIHSFRSNN